MSGTETADPPDHDHDHDHAHSHHDHAQQTVPSDLALRVAALESLLIEKGLVDPAALDALVDTYEHKVGPRNGAKVVARAWKDPAYKVRLLTDATSAIAGSASQACKASTWLLLRTRPPSTTWSSARCARAIPIRCLVCPLFGISQRPIARVL